MDDLLIRPSYYDIILILNTVVKYSTMGWMIWILYTYCRNVLAGMVGGEGGGSLLEAFPAVHKIGGINSKTQEQ